MVGLSSKGPIVILYAHLALGEFGNKINKKVIRWFFLFNLELICTCEVFKKLNNCTHHSGNHKISVYWKTHLWKFIPNWTQNWCTKILFCCMFVKVLVCLSVKTSQRFVVKQVDREDDAFAVRKVGLNISGQFCIFYEEIS